MKIVKLKKKKKEFDVLHNQDDSDDWCSHDRLGQHDLQANSV